MMVNLDNIEGFTWDSGNIEKNLLKHRVSNTEAEEVFFDTEKVIRKDLLHSEKEERYIVLGKTQFNRLLFVVFTIRENKIRVISARDLNKKGKNLYEKRT